LTLPSGKWRLDRRAELHWRHFDGEWVVFEAGSGDTHQLDPLAAAVLMCLESEAQDINELAEIIASELGMPLSADLTARMGQLIEQFTTLGLVEAVSP
jgi:PqqD family protein of HPr-rel-A system